MILRSNVHAIPANTLPFPADADDDGLGPRGEVNETRLQASSREPSELPYPAALLVRLHGQALLTLPLEQ